MAFSTQHNNEQYNDSYPNRNSDQRRIVEKISAVGKSEKIPKISFKYIFIFPIQQTLGT